jgi:hypothetical protein
MEDLRETWTKGENVKVGSWYKKELHIVRINTQPIKKGIPKERHPNFFC